MATQPPTPDADAPEQAPAASDAQAAPPSTAGVYEYTDLIGRTYQFPDGPQSAEYGDVCQLPYDPADGRWQASKKKPTRTRDNDPEQAAKNAQQRRAAQAEQDAAASGKA